MKGMTRLILIVLLAGVSSGQQTPATRAEKEKSALRVSLEKGSSFLSESAAVVEVEIENLRDEPAEASTLDFQLVPKPRTSQPRQFVLGDESGFWAPMDLASKKPRGLPDNRRGRPQTRAQLTIPANSKLKLQVDLKALNWAKVISSVWPASPLFTVVPDGTYLLTADVTYFDRTSLRSKTIKSEIAEVRVQRRE